MVRGERRRCILCAKLHPGRPGFLVLKMFTGIIENLGTVVKRTENQLEIKADSNFVKKISQGLSISVNGICLTVVNFNQGSFRVDFMPETADKTNICSLQTGDRVNLELPATIETFLSGHIVQGHIDGLGKLENIKEEKNSRILKLSVPENITKYLVNKGSVTLNGISLTVIEAGNNSFTVGIIPFTWKETMLNTLNIGDYINIEVDILAKYLEKLIQK